MPANKGFFLLKSRLTKVVQQEILAAARAIVKQAPLFRPTMVGSPEQVRIEYRYLQKELC